MNEERRYSLHERLVAVLGATDANTLMEHLPPTTWSDLVRQRDIDVLRVAVSSDMTLLHAELRGEMSELRSELKHEMNELRAEMRGEMAALRNDLAREMDRRFTKQMWQFITTTIGLQALTIASIGVMFANMN